MAASAVLDERSGPMKRSKFSEEQIVYATRQPEAGTPVSDRGVLLSGGQRQRVALARGFYFERDIIVLDEATSANDEDTERAIVDEIMALRGDKTLIVITHRPAAAGRCERVFRLSQGEVTQESLESLSSKP
jgi:ABC-type bacteriocin/lantibiotic exporter with double-glycine peptidase domain